MKAQDKRPKNDIEKPILRLVGVSKNFGIKQAVKTVDIELPRSQILSIIGPSGAGKTTLLNMIAGWIRHDLGTIEYNGSVINDVEILRNNIAVVPQNYSLFPFMSVVDNVCFPLIARNTPSVFDLLKMNSQRKKRKKVLNLVEPLLYKLGLNDHVNKKPSQLSGGEQQRVAIARAFAQNPDIICLDEPFSALDEQLRVEVQEIFLDLCREQGQSAIYVTHDQKDGMALGDSLAIMVDGKVVQIGSPQDLYCNPKTVFAARFLGGCNVFPIRAHKVDAVEHKLIITDSLSLVAPSGFPQGCKWVGLRAESLHPVQKYNSKFPVIEAKVKSLWFQGTGFRINLDFGDGILAGCLLPNGSMSKDLDIGHNLGLCYNSSDLLPLESGL